MNYCPTLNCRLSSDSGYNPYLSAERQMAELFDDSKKPSLSPPPAPKADDQEQQQQDEQATSMEQLELDLKSILSEISQLGKTNNERDQANRDNYTL